MLYDFLYESIQTQFSNVKVLKESQHGRVSLIRHKKKGTLLVLRQFSGSAKVYRKLLTVECANLPRVVEVAEKDGEVMVLEEFIQGDTLSEVLKGSALTPKQVRDIARQLCRGLWVLHTMGVVHLDVKPSNIILRGNEAVLIDFDAAREYAAVHRTDTNILGTVGYAAPEQFGLSQTDERADIYALGVTMNVMLTGAHPSVKLANRRMGRIIQKCTMVSPQKRYPNILYLMETL